MWEKNRIRDQRNKADRADTDIHIHILVHTLYIYVHTHMEDLLDGLHAMM